MLREWLQHLTTPCPPHLRRLGYLKQLIGMAARHKRCRAAWAPHLQQTRDMILEAADACSGRATAVILGSGLWLDVPVEELSGRFDEVVLVDILHMPGARRAVAGFDNVRLEDRDVTGVVKALSEGMAPQPDADLGADSADLVVSCNILSQLGVLLEDVSPGIAPQLMAAHLAALDLCSGTVCLISETSHRRMDGGVEIEVSDPLAGADIPQNLKTVRRQWDWHFAPHPERHPRHDLVFTVAGFMSSAGK